MDFFPFSTSTASKAQTEEKFCQMEHHTSDIRKINWNVRYYVNGCVFNNGRSLFARVIIFIHSNLLLCIWWVITIVVIFVLLRSYYWRKDDNLLHFFQVWSVNHLCTHSLKVKTSKKGTIKVAFIMEHAFAENTFWSSACSKGPEAGYNWWGCACAWHSWLSKDSRGGDFVLWLIE